MCVYIYIHTLGLVKILIILYTYTNEKKKKGKGKTRKSIPHDNLLAYIYKNTYIEVEKGRKRRKDENQQKFLKKS